MNSGEEGVVNLAVISTASAYDLAPASVRLVLGHYSEDGWNHGKKVYRRVSRCLRKSVPELVIFYWDNRDGGERAGWWFGSQVGGGDVWARNKSDSLVPPERGWHCPADGPLQEGLLCFRPPKPLFIPRLKARSSIEPSSGTRSLAKPTGSSTPAKRMKTSSRASNFSETQEEKLNRAIAIAANLEGEADDAVAAWNSAAALISTDETRTKPLDFVVGALRDLRRCASKVEQNMQWVGMTRRLAVKLEDPDDVVDFDVVYERLQIALSNLQQEMSQAERMVEEFEWREIELFECTEVGSEEDEERNHVPFTASSSTTASLWSPNREADCGHSGYIRPKEETIDVVASAEAKKASLQRWTDRVQALAKGNAAGMALCRRFIRQRVLWNHAKGNLANVDWEEEPLPDKRFFLTM